MLALGVGNIWASFDDVSPASSYMECLQRNRSESVLCYSGVTRPVDSNDASLVCGLLTCSWNALFSDYASKSLSSQQTFCIVSCYFVKVDVVLREVWSGSCSNNLKAHSI